jgi:N2-acetyl-L-2,4-diaminobutanoate deacetylase
MRPSPISASVDFDRDGVQHGFLRLPHSRDDSAWGAIMIPVSVIKRGEGPTALLTGANHGDEYEGPVALFKLAGSLRAEEVTGRVIIVPAMNYPAFRAGRRTSPIDQGNLNRAFPGRANGTITEKIADHFQRCLLPMAEYVLDIHSGGKTLDFVPFAAVHVLPDAGQQARCEAAMRAFGVPYSLMLRETRQRGHVRHGGRIDGQGLRVDRARWRRHHDRSERRDRRARGEELPHARGHPGGGDRAGAHSYPRHAE